MLQRIHIGNEKVLAFNWEGKFDKKAFEKDMTRFTSELKTRDKFNVYIEMHGIEGVEAKAVWEDLKFGVKNIKELTEKIDRVALVTDKDWVKNLAKVSYSVIPNIKLKTFAFKEKEVAKLWVIE